MEKIERLVDNVVIKKADELCVGDVILDSGLRFENKDGIIAQISPPRLVRVWDLGLVGDDVIVNAGQTVTSIGNKFLVISDNNLVPVKAWKFEDADNL